MPSVRNNEIFAKSFRVTTRHKCRHTEVAVGVAIGNDDPATEVGVATASDDEGTLAAIEVEVEVVGGREEIGDEEMKVTATKRNDAGGGKQCGAVYPTSNLVR